MDNDSATIGKDEMGSQDSRCEGEAAGTRSCRHEYLTVVDQRTIAEVFHARG